jgi:hypothetical protein
MDFNIQMSVGIEDKNKMSSRFAPQICNKRSHMTQDELRRDFGLLLCGSTGLNYRWNRFQRRHGGFPCKGTYIHGLNVNGCFIQHY